MFFAIRGRPDPAAKSPARPCLLERAVALAIVCAVFDKESQAIRRLASTAVEHAAMSVRRFTARGDVYRTGYEKGYEDGHRDGRRTVQMRAVPNIRLGP